MSRTGSPVPRTSNSSSTSLTAALFIPLRRDQDGYRGNLSGYTAPAGAAPGRRVVSAATDPTTLERARAAASRAAWQEAYDLLREAESGGLLGPADRPLL